MDRLRRGIATAAPRIVTATLAMLLPGLLLAACAAGHPAPATAAPTASTHDAAPPADPGRSCRVDADCVVKDVGSCCGLRPACVHRESRPDPDAVAAACARDGVASTCGFVAIVACGCDGGTCRDQGETTSQWIRDGLRHGSAG
jgi:hypothetical protein